MNVLCRTSLAEAMTAAFAAATLTCSSTDFVDGSETIKGFVLEVVLALRREEMIGTGGLWVYMRAGVARTVSSFEPKYSLIDWSSG